MLTTRIEITLISTNATIEKVQKKYFWLMKSDFKRDITSSKLELLILFLCATIYKEGSYMHLKAFM